MADNKRQDQPGPRPESRDISGSQHIADEPATNADPLGATVQRPTTESGLPVEEQVGKEWDTNKDGGLPTLLCDEAR